MEIDTFNFLSNKDFETIQILVVFPIKEKRENLAKTRLLPSMLSYVNNKYNTEEKFEKERKRNYILRINCYHFSLNNSGFLAFNMLIPKQSVIEEDLLEEQIKFFREMIYNPLTKNKAFTTFEFKREKENLKRNMEDGIKRINSYYTYRLKNLIDDGNTAFSSNLYDNKDLIKMVTKENLYSFYEEVVLNNKPIIFVMGDVNKKKISSLMEKYICKDINSKVMIDTNYSNYLEVKDKVKVVEEKGIFKDSVFSIVYKVENMSDKDRLRLEVVRNLLVSQSSRVLDKKLRGDFDLVYSTNVGCYKHYGTLVIIAYINKKSRNIVEEKIKEVMEELKNEKLLKELGENLKDRLRINIIRHLDSKYSLFDEFIYKKLDIEDTMEEEYEEALNITPREIKEFIERLKIDVIYYLEEES